MKVLQFCPKPPLPAIDGGCLASYELSQGLMSAGTELTLVSLATEKHSFQKEKIDPAYLKDTSFEAIQINTKVSLIALFMNLLKGYSFYKERFYQRQVRTFLKSHLKKTSYDLIVFDGLMTCFYMNDVRNYSGAKLVYRSHNIEHELLYERAKNQNNFLKRAFLGEQAKRLKLEEIQFWKTSDAIWSISSVDLDKIIEEVPNSKVNLLPFSIESESENIIGKSHTIFHLGAMDWAPNVEGLKWFIKEVWPKVLVEQKQAELHLGGKSIERFQKEFLGQNIFIHNVVPNANDFYDAYEIMIVPIHIGSGIRIKLIQALAKGKVIVSTKKGAEGIPAQNGRDLLISESAEEMASQLIELLSDGTKKEQLSKNARELYLKNFSRDTITAQLTTLMHS